MKSTANGETPGPVGRGVDDRGFGAASTVYVLVNDPHAARCIQRLAETHAWQIWWGKSAAYDFIAAPCFAMVLDRRLLGRDKWDLLVSLAGEANDGPDLVVDGETLDCRDVATCILVDDLRDWPVPHLPCVVSLATDNARRNEWLETSLMLAFRR